MFVDLSRCLSFETFVTTSAGSESLLQLEIVCWIYSKLRKALGTVAVGLGYFAWVLQTSYRWISRSHLPSTNHWIAVTFALNAHHRFKSLHSILPFDSPAVQVFPRLAGLSVLQWLQIQYLFHPLSLPKQLLVQFWMGHYPPQWFLLRLSSVMRAMRHYQRHFKVQQPQVGRNWKSQRLQSQCQSSWHRVTLSVHCPTFLRS